MDNHDHNPGHRPAWSCRAVFLLVRSALFSAFTTTPDHGDGCWFPFVSLWGLTRWAQRPPLFNRLPMARKTRPEIPIKTTPWR